MLLSIINQDFKVVNTKEKPFKVNIIKAYNI